MRAVAVVLLVLLAACAGRGRVDEGMGDLFSGTAAVSAAVDAGGDAAGASELEQVEAAWAAIADEVEADEPLIHLEVDEAMAVLRRAVEDGDADLARRAHLAVAGQVDRYLAGDGE